MTRNLFMAMALLVAVLLGCEDPLEATEPDDPNKPRNGSDGDGDGSPNQETGEDNCESILVAIVRDFPDGHPDFHHTGLNDDYVTDMVQTELDGDDKPVRGTADFYSENIDEWYRTIDEVNIEFEHRIELIEQEAGRWVYDNSEFFPLGPDDGFGSDIEAYKTRNYLFTTEIVLNFTYEKGQIFTFRGDDDLWVFINRKLAIDLGGIAKGWTADYVVERGWALSVGAGGDIRSAQDDAVVEVLDPWTQPIARVHLGAGGLATSSQTRRRWRAGGRTVHHLIDPRSGHPADSPVLSATALAETAAYRRFFREASLAALRRAIEK